MVKVLYTIKTNYFLDFDCSFSPKMLNKFLGYYNYISQFYKMRVFVYLCVSKLRLNKLEKRKN